MKKKISIALGAIAAILVVSGVISVLEFRHMSTSVSEVIAQDITNINISQKIASTTERFNLRILNTVGYSDSLNAVSSFNLQESITECEDVFLELGDVQVMPLTDTLMNAFIAYLEESKRLGEIAWYDFKDSRNWYFDELQPRYNELTHVLDSYNEDVHLDLMMKADEFKDAFYRSIVPGVVSVVAGLLLLALLLFFLLAYYIDPIYKMLYGLDDYCQHGRRYSFDFEGDDYLKKLNERISETVGENIELRKRVKALREQNEKSSMSEQ